MTTLPQTTGSRFPRAGNRLPAIPGQPQPGMGGGTQNSLTASDILRVLQQNFWLILLFLIVSIGAGFAVNELVLKKYFARYTAVGQLRVQTPTELVMFKSDSVITGSDQSTLEQRQKTYAQTLRHEALWRQVFSNQENPILKTTWFSQFRTRSPNGLPDTPNIEAAINDLKHNFAVTAIPETAIITVGMQSASADDSAIIVRQIVKRYLEREQAAATSGKEDEKRALRSARVKVEQSIRNFQAQVAERMTALSTDGAERRMGTLGMLEFQLSQMLAERIKSVSVFNELEVAYQNLEQQLQAGQVPASVSMQISMDPSLQRLIYSQGELEGEIAVQVAATGPQSKQVQNLQLRLDVTNSRIEARQAELRATIGESMREEVKSQRDQAGQNVQLIDSQIKEVQSRLGDLAAKEAELRTAQEALKDEKEHLAEIMDREAVIEMNIARDMRTRTNIWWVAPDDSIDGQNSVDKPETMSFPIWWQTVAVAGVLGTGLALGIAFLRELTDTTVRSPRDITKVGNLNLLGMIPHEDEDPQAAASELAVIISQAPHSMIAEQFRHVRTRLQHAASLDTTRSLLITSPAAGDGKTVVACNIAAGLALNGRKILLVDANFRRPDIHRIFGVSNDVGFGNVLAQQSSLDAAVRKTNIPNLDVLATGPRPANPTELLESQLLTEFIDHALEEYDHVIFDAGPVLLVSETVALAPRVDGVITVVKARANSRGLLTRMRDTLRQLKAEHLGVVLNGVRQQTGGYYARNIKSYYAYQNGN